MLALLGALIAQAIDGEVAVWVSVVSLAGALIGPGLAGARVFRNARRLGRREDDLATQSRLARTILHDHLVCLAAMLAVLAAQLAA